ncbi:MAG: hypothetical protein ACRD4R_06245 [Candidatus Acidiferrales bacterium]
MLGLCIAFLTLDSARSTYPSPSLAFLPLILAGLPLLDAALAVIRRANQRSSPLLGDRRHFYDLLLTRGLSPGKVTLACYGITLAFALVAWLGMRFGSRCFEISSAIGLAGLLILAVRLGSLRLGDENEEKIDHACEVAPSGSSEGSA